MLRHLTTLACFLRRRTPGARERLTYRMLQALVLEPEARPVLVREERSPRR
jgi:hypothetical protein